jgi:hypothetical protein
VNLIAVDPADWSSSAFTVNEILLRIEPGRFCSNFRGVL